MNIVILSLVILLIIITILLLIQLNNKSTDADENQTEKVDKSKYVPFEPNKAYNTKWDFVDKIIYINLDERLDRRMEMQEVLSVIPDKSKIVRLSAIKYSPGNIGCTMSHIKALKLAIQNNWRNVLILEDDAGWNNYEQGYNKLVNLLHRYPNYDVITLGNTWAEFDKPSARVIKGFATSGYLANGHYFKKLLANFEKGLELLLLTGDCPTYCLDVYWEKLMKHDNWYIVNPALVIQRPSKSNIEEGVVDYVNFFNLEKIFLLSFLTNLKSLSKVLTALLAASASSITFALPELRSSIEWMR